MKIKVIGTGPLARAYQEAAEKRAGWSLAREGERPDRVLLCGPEAVPIEQVSKWAVETGGVLCATAIAWPENAVEQLAKLVNEGKGKALRPECFWPHVAGVKEALAGRWLGKVGAVNLTRKEPFSPTDFRDALSRCGLTEASVILSLLGQPERIFCTAADLEEQGEQVSLTLQMCGGAVVNIQAVQGGTTAPYFQYEYAGEYGLADYDSRQGAIRLNGEGALMEEWTQEVCVRAVEAALSSADDNGMLDLLRLQKAARRSIAHRQVVEWKGVEL